MRALNFVVRDWLGEAGEAPVDSVTLASLSIEVHTEPGAERICVTEVEDTIARTVRDHITVPAYPVVQWLLVNWWRLRWEPRPPAGTPGRSWLRAHSMASIGSGFAWPAVELASDGSFVQLQLQAEAEPDVAAIRYLRNVAADVPAADFEAAVDAFADAVQGRLAASTPESKTVLDLRAELAEERSDPVLARHNKWQALAGINSGDGTDEWLAAVTALSGETGAAGIDEVMAIAPHLELGLETARKVVERIRSSATRVDLSAITRTPATNGRPELPWQKGERIAADMRRRLAHGSGPMTNGDLGALLGIALPVATATHDRRLAGAFRTNADGLQAAVLVPSSRAESQRFYFARLIGCAMVSSENEILLPVTTAATSLQKFERAFAQELLCPWRELDRFTDEHGLDEDGVFEAAAHFGVSEMLVQSTLVNKGKVRRDRLMQG